MPDRPSTTPAGDATPPPALSAAGRSPAARAAEGLVWLYQQTLSPALAAAFPTCGCRFHPTCSHYARGALREHGLIAGGALTVARLARCGPWHPGGLDPVPPRRPVCTAAAPSLVTHRSPLS